MPETEWTPLHDFYAQDLDHNLTVVECYVESGDPYKIHECAQVFLTLWTTYIFLRKALNAHDRLALGRRIALDYYAVYGGLRSSEISRPSQVLGFFVRGYNDRKETTMYWTRERDLRILAGLHWAMQRKAERHAALARELLEQGCDALPDFAVEDHEAEMRDCRRIAKILATP